MVISTTRCARSTLAMRGTVKLRSIMLKPDITPRRKAGSRVLTLLILPQTGFMTRKGSIFTATRVIIPYHLLTQPEWIITADKQKMRNNKRLENEQRQLRRQPRSR